MATKGNNTSLRSIALLQERFRQLQKVREMREERELLHVLSVPESAEKYSYSSNNTCHLTMHKYPYQPSTLFFDSELNFQQKPSSQLALSLWPDSQIKNSNVGGLEIANGTTKMTNKSWLDGTTLGYNSESEAAFKFDESNSDIDTSLHL